MICYWNPNTTCHTTCQLATIFRRVSHVSQTCAFNFHQILFQTTLLFEISLLQWDVKGLVPDPRSPKNAMSSWSRLLGGHTQNILKFPSRLLWNIADLGCHPFQRRRSSCGAPWTFECSQWRSHGVVGRGGTVALGSSWAQRGSSWDGLHQCVFLFMSTTDVYYMLQESLRIMTQSVLVMLNSGGCLPISSKNRINMYEVLQSLWLPNRSTLQEEKLMIPVKTDLVKLFE